MRCDLTDLEESACAHCRGLSLTTPGAVTVVNSFVAHFDSRCSNCDGEICSGCMTTMIRGQ